MRIPYGIMNQVYKVPGTRSILKIRGRTVPGVYRSLSREAAACKFLSKSHNILVPSIKLHLADRVLLTKMLSGVSLPLAQSDLTSVQKRHLAFNIGESLGRIHSVPLSGVPARLQSPFQGEVWPEQALNAFFIVANIVENIRPSLGELMSRCRRQLEARVNCVEYPDRGLIHGDYGGSNILVNIKNNEVSGIVDWEWALVGDVELDLAQLAWINSVGRPTHIWANTIERDYFIQGYRQFRPSFLSLEEEKFAWYGLWFAVSFLAVRFSCGMENTCNWILHYIETEAQKW